MIDDIKKTLTFLVTASGLHHPSSWNLLSRQVVSRSQYKYTLKQRTWWKLMEIDDQAVCQFRNKLNSYNLNHTQVLVSIDVSIFTVQVCYLPNLRFMVWYDLNMIFQRTLVLLILVKPLFLPHVVKVTQNIEIKESKAWLHMTVRIG